MDNIAYKYIVIGGDILFVFPFVEDGVRQEDAAISHTIHMGKQWLRLGASMYVPLNDDIIALLQRSGTLILAESEDFDFRISYKGEITIDPILVGRILVYYEMGKEQIERGAHVLNEDYASLVGGGIVYAEAGQGVSPGA